METGVTTFLPLQVNLFVQQNADVGPEQAFGEPAVISEGHDGTEAPLASLVR